MLKVEIPEKISLEFDEEFPELTSVAKQLLFNRSITSADTIERFLNPEYSQLHNPFLFKHMNKACRRIFEAIEKDQLIAIHGDYDADGVSAAAILHTVINKLGGKTIIYIPHREKEGYGLNLNTVEYLKKNDVKLIITCDCGISNIEEVDKARALGIDTIITDHHQVPEKLPSALAIIHPKVKGEKYPFHGLAGGGVAFKLAQGLIESKASKMNDREKEIAEKWLLDLVAISTVADMVPLLGENRVLVKFGLVVMSHLRRPGLAYLFKLARIEPSKVDSETIGYRVAPRINAAGRMDHANTAYLLLTESSEKEIERLALLLEDQNKQRQVTTEKVVREARTMLDPKSPIIFVRQDDWPPGLTGLVAGRLLRDTGKPCFVICHDGKQLVGSGRAPDGVNILDSITIAKKYIDKFGGHPQACGFRFAQEKYDKLVASISKSLGSVLKEKDRTLKIKVDADISFTEITWPLMEELSKFEPFGQGNPSPQFLSRKIEIVEAKPVGKKMAHLKLKLRNTDRVLPAIAFSRTGAELEQGHMYDLVYNLSVNEWNGNREIQLSIKEIVKVYA